MGGRDLRLRSSSSSLGNGGREGGEVREEERDRGNGRCCSTCLCPATQCSCTLAALAVPGTCPRQVVVDGLDAQAAGHALHEHVGDVALCAARQQG